MKAPVSAPLVLLVDSLPLFSFYGMHMSNLGVYVFTVCSQYIKNVFTSTIVPKSKWILMETVTNYRGPCLCWHVPHFATVSVKDVYGVFYEEMLQLVLFTSSTDVSMLHNIVFIYVGKTVTFYCKRTDKLNDQPVQTARLYIQHQTYFYQHKKNKTRSCLHTCISVCARTQVRVTYSQWRNWNESDICW